MDKEKKRILKRNIKELLLHIKYNNFKACKNIIDNITELLK
jgi:hypothetical protein